MTAVRAGTRKSALATWQTKRVLRLLTAAHRGLRTEIISMDTTGDLNQHDPLPSIGAKGLFTAELEAALRGGMIDIAVHSLKDLPTRDADGLVLGAILERADVRDVLVARGGLTLAELPPGAVIGTSSMRRAAQIRMLRPDVCVESIRGNVQTRLEKVERGAYHATVMAAAGLVRMDLLDVVTEWFETATMLPAPGQAALAVQCREGDERVLKLLRAVHDEDVARATTAERTFLAVLEGGCSSPVAACARIVDRSSQTEAGDGRHLVLEGLVAAPSGQKSIRIVDSGTDPVLLGRAVAEMALERGAARLVAVSEPRRGGRLEGWRVVVTRAAHQAASLIDALAAEGAVPVAIPGIEIRPIRPNPALRAAVEEIDSFDCVVCTSSNGVDVLFNALPGAALPASVRAAAVGSRSADAFRAHGADNVFVPDEFTGEELARALVAGAGPGARGAEAMKGVRVLLIQASGARRAAADALRSAGADLTAVAAYDTATATASTEAQTALAAGAHALTFTSPSTARAFRAQFGDLADTVAATAVIAVIGPVTARAVEDMGWPVHVVAEPHTAEGLVHGLVRWAVQSEQQV